MNPSNHLPNNQNRPPLFSFRELEFGRLFGALLILFLVFIGALLLPKAADLVTEAAFDFMRMIDKRLQELC